MQPGSKPLTLSLVIPAYNEESHLKLCLNAVAKQTVAPFEVLVVDNNSTDATADIAAQYDFVRLVHEKKQGIVFARNRGFDEADGELIGRIDADTILPVGWVEDVLRFYKHKDRERTALTGGATFRNMPFPRSAGWLQKLLAFQLNHLALGHHILWGSNMVIPAFTWRAVRKKVCLLPYIHEDIDLAIHVYRAGFPIMYRPQLQVSAVMRRVLTNRQQLWPNLKWWPRTLRLHRIKTWPLTVYGAGSVFIMSILIRITSGRATDRPD